MRVESLITEHIDIWTAAIKTKSASGRGSSKKVELYGIKKLRELILELAVRGKLVAQDPNDEPASVLLERIAKEKEQLVKEKKIKKPKVLPEIFDEERPFDLPKGWSFAYFPEVADFFPGKTPSTKNSLFWSDNREIPWVSISDLNDTGTVNTTNKYISKEAKEQIFKKEPSPAGTLLMSFKLTVGKISVLGIDAFHNEAIISIFPNQCIRQEYLSRILPARANAGNKKNAIMGATLNSQSLALIIIPLPPLAEQHRIVAKVDELMALCDQLESQTENQLDTHQQLVQTLLDTLTNSANHAELEQNWALLAAHFDALFTTEQSIDLLKQTILQLAVMGKLVPQDPNDEPASKLLERIAAEKAQLIKEGKIKKQKALPPIKEDEKPFELPEGWACERVGTFCIVGTGATPSRNNIRYWEPAQFNWVSSGETSHLFIESTNEKISELAIQETNVSIYPVGTLIVAMYGQGKTRGQVSELLEPAGTNQACAAIQFVCKSEFHKKYVKLFFLKAYDELRSTAAGGAQPNLNVGKVASTVIPFPPLSEQHRIVAKVDELMTICDALKSQLAQAQQTQLHLTDAITEQVL